jgi:uncharacterized protein YegL
MINNTYFFTNPRKMPVGLPEFVDNPENRCPVILLLDTSASMSGKPIEQLNEALIDFKQDITRDDQACLSVEIALVTFGPVKLVHDFVTVENFIPPSLKADGMTPMGEAIEYALDLLEQRKQNYKTHGIVYYRPWIFLITDGAPTDHWQTAAHRIRIAEEEHRLLFFTVAVQGADIQTLKQIAPLERPPVTLRGLDFRSLFLWLSTSMKRISGSKIGQAVSLPPMGWGQINT